MKTIVKSERLHNVSYEVRGPLAEEAERMAAQGREVLQLNIGNPAVFGFTASDKLLEQLGRSAAASQAYSGAQGSEAARCAIVEYDRMRGIPGVTPGDVFTGNGASELIEMALDALLNPGDEILIPSPDYPLWTAAATLAGGRVVHYLCDEHSGWYPDLTDLERKITPRTKALVIINPNNPTGAVYPRELLEGMVKLAREHSLVIFSDEIYDRLILGEEQHISVASLAPDVLCVTMNGLSKSHMLCGFRVGWMTVSGNKAAAADYLEGIGMLADMRLCSNVPGQSLIPAALSGKLREEEYFVPGGRVQRQRDTVYELLNAIPGVTAVKPRAAFYIFPGLDREKFGLTDDRRFALDLLRATGILVVPGSGFNWAQPDHFRIVYLPQEERLRRAMLDMGDFLQDYRQN